MNNINCKVDAANSAYVSVITCTNRQDYMENVFNNFLKQKYNKKQLIIILNNNFMNIHEWQERTGKFNNIKVYQLDENITLGECLNFGILQSDYDFIAKFDDDDYYDPRYLSDSINAFKYAEAGVVGKASTYVFFEGEKILALRGAGKENCYVKHIDGPTLFIKREVFNYVKFRDINRGEDKYFCKDCINLGIMIYSTNRFYHAYIRHSSAQQHTWTIENSELLKHCKVIARDVKDYREYITIKIKPLTQLKECCINVSKRVKSFIGDIRLKLKERCYINRNK